MSGEHDPPNDGEVDVDAATLESEVDVEPPPTDYERLLIEQAGDVVGSCARRIASSFPRHVGQGAVMQFGDIYNIGHIALYHAARAYDPAKNPNFPAFARYYVHGAMLSALDDLFFQERVDRACTVAAANLMGNRRDHDYNVMKHDEVEARRRYRAFANGLLAATFTAGLEEAQQHLDEAEPLERRQYELALLVLRAALSRLVAAERALIEVMYGKMLRLKDAAELLGVPEPTARARHSRALAALHDELVKQGVQRVPKPLVAPYVGDFLDPDAAAQNDTRGE